MAEYKTVITNAKLAKEVADATSQYQDQVIALLERAKQVEEPNDYKNFALTIGQVLATLGQSILFPIYRQPPSLTPEALKTIIEKNPEPDAGRNEC